MSTFIALSLLICPSPQEARKDGAMACYPDHDIELRTSVIREYEEYDYVECKEGADSTVAYKCKKDVIAGCKFTLDNGSQRISALSCPYGG